MKSLIETTKYALYFFIFLIPIQTRLMIRHFEIGKTVGRGLVEYLSISLYITDLALIMLLILFLSFFNKTINERASNKISKEEYAIIGLDFFIFISLFFAHDKLVSIYHYSLFLLSIALLFLITRAKYNQNKLVFAFIFSIVIQGVFAIWQFFSQRTVAFKWLGLSSHIPSELGTSVIEIIGKDGIPERWLRSYGGFGSPNILGGVLVIALIFVLNYFLKHKKKDKETDWKMLSIYFSLIILFIAILLTFSRSAWLAFMISFLFLFFWGIIKRDKFFIFKMLKVSLVFLGALIIIILPYYDLFGARIVNKNGFNNVSSYKREYFLTESKELIKDNFFTGVGVGNYIEEIRLKRPGNPSWTYQPVHNTFFLVLSEIGVFGFLFYLGLLFVILIKSIKRKSFLNIAILITLFTIMLFDHWLWSLHFGIFFFWFIIGVLIKNINK